MYFLEQFHVIRKIVERVRHLLLSKALMLYNVEAEEIEWLSYLQRFIAIFVRLQSCFFEIVLFGSVNL